MYLLKLGYRLLDGDIGNAKSEISFRILLRSLIRMNKLLKSGANCLFKIHYD